MSNVLAFDYGTSFIGVAVGQKITGSSRPLTTIVRKNKQYDWSCITELLATWQPQELVVGLPLDLDDSEQEMSGRTRRFANQLRGRFNLPVHEVDERLTTMEASAIISAMEYKEFKKYKVSRKQMQDMVAAHLILRFWFDTNAQG